MDATHHPAQPHWESDVSIDNGSFLFVSESLTPNFPRESLCGQEVPRMSSISRSRKYPSPCSAGVGLSGPSALPARQPRPLPAKWTRGALLSTREAPRSRGEKDHCNRRAAGASGRGRLMVARSPFCASDSPCEHSGSRLLCANTATGSM